MTTPATVIFAADATADVVTVTHPGEDRQVSTTELAGLTVYVREAANGAVLVDVDHTGARPGEHTPLTVSVDDATLYDDAPEASAATPDQAPPPTADVRPYARHRARQVLAVHSGEPVPEDPELVSREALADLLTDLLHLVDVVDLAHNDDRGVLASAQARRDRERLDPAGYAWTLPAPTTAASTARYTITVAEEHGAQVAHAQRWTATVRDASDPAADALGVAAGDTAREAVMELTTSRLNDWTG